MFDSHKLLCENDKRMSGRWYDANFDAGLVQQRACCASLCWHFNQTNPSDDARLQALREQLLPHCANSVTIVPPLQADYGDNCFIGEHTFINLGAYFMDGAPITIGSWCFIGPHCGFYTARHPLLAQERNQGLERAEPITLGNNIWVGGNVIFLPGVSVGSGSVIGAGSVVTKDIPPNCIAFGNPCRVQRTITQEDSIYFSKDK